MGVAVESDHSDGSKPIAVSSNGAVLTREQEIERQFGKVAAAMKASRDRLAALTSIANERKAGRSPRR
jgi:hypothetical protein